MGELDRVRMFLGAVRRRVLLRDGLRGAAFAAAAVLAILLGLAVSAASLGPANFWRPMTAAVAGGALLVALFLGVWRPWHALKSDHRTARAVGRLAPALRGLAGDLVSAVQLGTPPGDPAGARGAASPPDAASATSGVLIRAFQNHVAEAIAPLDPRLLVPMRPAALGGLVLLAAAALLAGAARYSPEVVGRGLTTLLHKPNRFEGAAVSAVPLVGDVRITYEYPPYTGLPPRTVEGSTGDVVAVKGTRVKIETTPLHISRNALLLLGDAGEGGELPVRLQKGTLTVHLTLLESGSYRFWLQPLIGRAVREQRSHRLEAEVDRPPRVEIHGPADRLDLPTPRPIEVGFAADDDYGLGAIELVFRVDDGPEQRQLLKDGLGARLAQGRTLWDPAHAGLSPGARIAYHLEARDRDEVSGAKAGVSRTLYVVIARPQESIDARLDRQREILERLIADLGDRLETLAAPLGRTGASPTAAELDARRAAYARLGEAEEAHLTLLGRFLDDDRHEGLLGKPLRAALTGIADRLGKLLREEKDALGKSTERTLGVKAEATVVSRLSAQRDRHVAELEKDVLLLDDLIGRQRLEDLAAIGRELTDAHAHLKDLLARYAATKDEALRRQLEREVRDLRARIGDLAQKIAELKGRNDIPDEWRNLPDTQGLAEQAKKLDDLLAQGDPKALDRALGQLGKDLHELRQMLDDNAEGFGAERFPQENRVVSDLMKKIGDLEGDERALAGETQSLAGKQDAETEKRLRAKLGEWTRAENEKVEKLRQKLGEIKTGDPESALGEEVERARESTRQMKRLLGERDLAEAKDQADHAAASLERARAQVDPANDNGRKRKPSEARTQARAEAAESLAAARAIAQEISDDMGQLLPKAEETLSPAERDSARAQSERQGAIGDRTDDTAREAARRVGKIPGLEHAEQDLRDAAEQMRQASQHLRKSEAKQAGGAEQNAAERLAKLRDTLQERSIGSGRQQRDPVRIPGADESNAPRAWRQDLMDAMKEKAPEHFRDDVRRYYEELVR